MKIRTPHILLACIILFCMSFGFLFYDIFLNGIVNPILSYRSDPMALNTDKAAYHLGDSIKVEVNVCKNRDVSAEVHWSLVDSIIVDYPVHSSDKKPRCVDAWTEIGSVPKSLEISDGESVHVEGTVAYHLNDFNTRIYRLQSKPFKIIK